MPATNSFDITSGVDLQEVDNAINQALKEIAQRYDFRGVVFEIALKKLEKVITLAAPDEFKLDAIWEIVLGRMAKRGVPAKNLKRGDLEKAAGSTVRQTVTLQQGIPIEAAKDIVKWVKDAKLKKVQASIQADQVRVTSPSRDDLQAAMAGLRAQDFGVELKFGNFRTQ
jgi:cyclic-di-GMP-binding protein